MASQVEIANRALTKVGDTRIISLTDNVETARIISVIWDTVRDNELRAHNWNFSIIRASIPALLSAPAFGYSYAFQLPTDCLRVIQAGDYYPGPSMSNYRNANEAVYQIEGGKILTNLAAPLKIRYISRFENTGGWDSAFTEVFACRLALESCEKITQSNTKKQVLGEEYKMALRVAVLADAIENPPDPIPDDSWVLSRL